MFFAWYIPRGTTVTTSAEGPLLLPKFVTIICMKKCWHNDLELVGIGPGLCRSVLERKATIHKDGPALPSQCFSIL